MENEFLVDDLEVQKDALPQDKSVDIFNALSLADESLGKLYVEQGYNPYGENFVLTEEYAGEILHNKVDASEKTSQSFLEQSNSEISKNFTTALENCDDLVTALENEQFVARDSKLKEQIGKTIVSLKNRSELLKLDITKLKQKDANAIKMYIELYGMDGELGELLKDTFTEKANMQALILQFMALIQKRAGTVYAKAQNLKNKVMDAATLKQEIDKAVEQSKAEDMRRQAELQEIQRKEREEQELQEKQEQEERQREEEQQKKNQQDTQKSNDEEFSR